MPGAEVSVRRSGRGRPCRTSLLIGRPAQLLPPPPLPPTSNKPSDTSAQVLITLAVHGGIGAQICKCFSQLSKVWCQNASCLSPKSRTTLVRGAGCLHVREHGGESQLRWMAARSPNVLKRPPRPRPRPTQLSSAGLARGQLVILVCGVAPSVERVLFMFWPSGWWPRATWGS